MRLRSDRRPGAGPPAYLGIGTIGADTTWFHALLCKHPQVDGPRGPEASLLFFDQFCSREMTDEDVARYHAAFPQRPGVLSGEWTSRYVYDAWTPPLLRRAAPDAKLLVLLSDPIVRYARRLAAGRALVESEDEQVFMSDAANRGRYATQLRDLFAVFPAEQVLVLQTERFRADPVGQYRRTLRFLGVDEAFVPRRLRRVAEGRRALHPAEAAAVGLLRLVRGRRREPTPPPVVLWPDLEAALHDLLDPEIAALPALVPDVDLSLWPAFAGLSSSRRPS